jgi:hypothetical protein
MDREEATEDFEKLKRALADAGDALAERYSARRERDALRADVRALEMALRDFKKSHDDEYARSSHAGERECNCPTCRKHAATLALPGVRAAREP